MEPLRQIAQQYVTEFRTFESDSPYTNDINFLKLLEEEYALKEYYEIASLIHSRIMILQAKNGITETMNGFGDKLQHCKELIS